ncbi:hypothetical protein EYF80_005999 [Liparis tanakae]|uniref:Uncharacterized protein n=1 Tax=Liparis tanakae TaxID=230148 RepID=A0A4Z2J2V7_9TELE|nr:hypothetical protein EYF80_005999 [Liparis tanakae]
MEINPRGKRRLIEREMHFPALTQNTLEPQIKRSWRMWRGVSDRVCYTSRLPARSVPNSPSSRDVGDPVPYVETLFPSGSPWKSKHMQTDGQMMSLGRQEDGSLYPGAGWTSNRGRCPNFTSSHWLLPSHRPPHIERALRANIIASQLRRHYGLLIGAALGTRYRNLRLFLGVNASLTTETEKVADVQRNTAKVDDCIAGPGYAPAARSDCEIGRDYHRGNAAVGRMTRGERKDSLCVEPQHLKAKLDSGLHSGRSSASAERRPSLLYPSHSLSLQRTPKHCKKRRRPRVCEELQTNNNLTEHTSAYAGPRSVATQPNEPSRSNPGEVIEEVFYRVKAPRGGRWRQEVASVDRVEAMRWQVEARWRKVEIRQRQVEAKRRQVETGKRQVETRERQVEARKRQVEAGSRQV